MLSYSGNSKITSWASEFNSGDLSHVDTSVCRSQNYSMQRDSSKTRSPNERFQQVKPQVRPYTSTRSFFKGIGTDALSHELHGSSYSRVSSCQKYAPLPDQSLDSMDWEAIFQSLDPTIHMEDGGETSHMHMSNEQVSTGSDDFSAKQTVEEMSRLRTPCPASNYNFQDENPFTEISDPFGEGMRIIDDDGNLSVAALAFEAACQLDHTHLDSWIMLGTVQSENDREETAIMALTQALKLDPNNLSAIMKLAVSYTNEGRESLAYAELMKWLRTRYPHIPLDQVEMDIQYPKKPESLEKIKDSFLRAAQLSISRNIIDPDVQVGLGVILFSEQNYEMAADCFASAIHSFTSGVESVGSQLHLLWNRYGACLGNMGKHEEAIEAYEMALAIRPNFVRARTNLGLLYYQKSDPKMGARHTLKALQEYRVGQSKAKSDMMKIVRMGSSHGRLEEVNYGPEPTSIYAALKKCCNSMGRWDLAGEVGPDMDFRKFEQELGTP